MHYLRKQVPLPHMYAFVPHPERHEQAEVMNE
jgi:hypothetical protein